MSYREPITVDVVIDQGGAGTTSLLTALKDRSYRMLNYAVVMSPGGTLAWSDGTDWKSGAMPIADNGGAVARGSSNEPLFTCGIGRPLNITTTGGSAHGHALVEIR